MPGLVSSARPLPADLAITERSRRFYDGTYRWDSDGFTDEQGVYREYDCKDPLARAPTPLPPVFLYDDEDEDNSTNPPSTETTQFQDGRNIPTLTESEATEPDISLPELDSGSSTALTSEAPRTPESIRRFAINLLNRPRQKKAAPQDERDVKLQVVENTMDLPEGTEPGSEPGEIVEILHRSYEHCEGPKPAKRGSSSMQMPDTPPASPLKTLSVIQDASPASTTSTLSPVPSTLSVYGNDKGIEIKGAAATQSIPSLPATPTRRKGLTTRGVALKVTKAKRASVNRSSPPKRKEKSVEEFTLLELHSGAFLHQGGLRKSARQAKLETN